MLFTQRFPLENKQHRKTSYLQYFPVSFQNAFVDSL